MSETIDTKKEFDQFLPIETERKFSPAFPERLSFLKNHDTATAIEQVYLSSPDEPFSLRLREYTDNQGLLAYEATLKDRGELSDEGLRRLEVTTPVSPELYEYYTSAEVPRLKKIRAEPFPGVTIDFYEDGTVQVESEDPDQWQNYKEQFGGDFIDVTGLPQADNEHRAHVLHGARNEEGYSWPTELAATQIVEDILAGSEPSALPKIVHIGGRSGSGKSTIVREVLSELRNAGLSSALLSTDDYHRGAKWLTHHNDGEPWTHWDERVVYDLESVQLDLRKLLAGSPIEKRVIDWTIVEPYVESVQNPADTIIVEGIYATDPSITSENDLTYTLPTPLATCVGRRLLRDIKERPQFSDPALSLLYMLEEAEPAYRRQHAGGAAK